jgi:phosphate:Na+ symporter
VPLPEDVNLIQSFGLAIGGLALFLFGLELMTDGLKAVAGARLQALLGSLTTSRFRGLLAGAGVTALLNSSTITTVLMVGFVSAGLMTLDQTIPMIMGANIGSTLTAQLIAFDLSAAAPFMLAVGFVLHAFARRELLRQLGGIILGFGVLFIGIEALGNATRPLRSYQPFIDAMQDISNPALGILIGAVFTAIVQSSAATLAIVIALASEGAIPLEAGIALVLGANVGTCGTALLAGIGKSPEAVQVGIVHLLFNVIGVCFFAFAIPQFADFVRLVSPSHPDLAGMARLAAETLRQVANAHTIFSVASSLVLIWFTQPMAWLARLLSPGRARPAEDPGAPRYLDAASLDVTALGIQRIQLELVRAGEHILDIARRGTSAALGERLQRADATGQSEEGTDRLASAILHYIGQLSEREHSEREAGQLVDLAQIVTRLEGIRELATLILASADETQNFTALRTPAFAALSQKVLDTLRMTVHLIGRSDEAVAEQILGAKVEIEALAASTRQSALASLHLGQKEDVAAFRLASELIERYIEIARLSRAVARATAELDRVGQIELQATGQPVTATSRAA